MEVEMDLLEKVKAAGVIGAGGAGFPTHVKLNAKADFILLNGAECEPLLRVDQQLMEYYPEEIIRGLVMAGEIVEAKKTIIGIKVKHKEVIGILNETIKKMGLEDQVLVGELPDVYPAGDEQVLVYELTGRVVPETGIPIAVGCVVVNAETAYNIYRASQDRAVTMKYVTVAGDVPNPVTLKVPVGTPLRKLFEAAGVNDLRGHEVIDGGPMMGPLLADPDGYVTKKTKGLVVLPEEHGLIMHKKREMKSAIRLNRSACEQCSMCTDMCPRHLLGHSTVPHKMVRAMAYGVEADETMTAALTCCQCNLCEYFSCPAGISPKMANVYYMNQLRSKGIKHDPGNREFVPHPMRDYRMVPSRRLIARIGIRKYDVAAPLDIEKTMETDFVGIHLDTHVGAPAKPVVEAGEMVTEGQLIADVPQGAMGAAVHASISGQVETTDNGIITIRRK
jgi:Na+-translocating ferredoxin:NAD+ oxidoreductase RnfC subunit